MKATGVVRRIDELGRIVIPKELRKNLRIKEGENIEIYLDDNENIILKKFSSLKNILDLSSFIVESISNITKLNVFITDTDSVVATSKSIKKEYLDKDISQSLSSILNENKNIKKETKENVGFINQKCEDAYYIVNLIKQNGDTVGAIVAFSDEEINSYIQIIDTFSLFLNKYLE